MSLLDRQEAYDLLCEYTKNPNLIKHMLAVEAAMRAYAIRFGENEDQNFLKKSDVLEKM